MGARRLTSAESAAASSVGVSLHFVTQVAISREATTADHEENTWNMRFSDCLKTKASAQAQYVSAQVLPHQDISWFDLRCHRLSVSCETTLVTKVSTLLTDAHSHFYSPLQYGTQ